MGMEFWITSLPAAKMTAERQAELHKIVDNLDDVDIPWCLEERIEDEEEGWCPREVLHEHVESLPNPYCRRDTTTRFLPKIPYPLIFTGGIAYGEEPNEIFDPMWTVEQCVPVYDKLEEWAIKDQHSDEAKQKEALERWRASHE